MRVSRLSGVALIALIAGLLSPVTVAYADPPPLPYAQVDSPAGGAEVTGPITVTGEGHVDPLAGATVISLTLEVDGSPVGTPVDCSLMPVDCSGTFAYDVSALASGPHALRIDMATSLPQDVLSPDVPVTVVTAPAVSITPVVSPVTGPVTVSVGGATDSSSAVTPLSIELSWGSTIIGTQNCPGTPDPHSCPVAFPWDSTGLNGTHDLVATMTLANSTAQPTATQVGLKASNPGPTVAITSPTAGAPKKGIITVSANGSVTGNQTDFADKLDLFVNSGTTPVDTVQCDTSQRSCSTTALSWDATGQPDGNYTLKVRFTTTHHTVTDSVQVHVTSPPPTVAITAPAQGATVFGVVPVTVVGNVDPSQTDTGRTLTLLVNGVILDTVDCPATRTCTLNYDWDASGIVGARTLKATFVTAGNKTATSDTTDVNVVSAPPAAVVVSPVNGSTVSGPITIVTQGSVSPTQNDHPATMQLLIDGTATAAAAPCLETAALPHGCSLSYGWDTTGLTGTHTLQAKFVTRKGVIVLSAVSTITVVSPLPTVTITSPSTSATVHRTATITVSGAVDATQTDAPSSIRLTLDGSALGGVIPCAPAVATGRTCLASYTWNTVGLTGRHTLAATIVSAKGVIGTSSATSVYVYGGTKTVIVPAKATPAGRSVTYTGRVTTLINKLGVPGVKVKVVIVPAKGKAKTLMVLTNVHGFFKVAFKPAVNTTVTATLISLPYYGASHTFTKLHVVPSFKCTVGRSVARNRLDQGACRIANLPKTTKVTLQYEFAGHWYTLGSGKAKSTLLPFSFRFAKRGTYYVRVVLSATSIFAGATGPSLKVAVT